MPLQVEPESLAAKREYLERSTPLETKVETLEETLKNSNPAEQDVEEPSILEDICVEELAIDGICGVY